MRLRRVKKKMRVEMTPLLDVVFLLLVFFIYSMLIMDVHRGTRVALPTSESARPERASGLALTVMAGGRLLLEQEAVTMTQLTERLRARRLEAERRHEPVPTLQIFAEDQLAYQELYRVLDTVREAGVHRISFQAREKTAQQP